VADEDEARDSCGDGHSPECIAVYRQPHRANRSLRR
jgi:hypothetical protein